MGLLRELIRCELTIENGRLILCCILVFIASFYFGAKVMCNQGGGLFGQGYNGDQFRLHCLNVKYEDVDIRPIRNFLNFTVEGVLFNYTNQSSKV
jgi:hypothetical protein